VGFLDPATQEFIVMDAANTRLRRLEISRSQRRRLRMRAL